MTRVVVSRTPRWLVVTGLIAGGLLALLAMSRVWVRGAVDGVAQGVFAVTGGDAAAAASGSALVVLAAAVLLAVSGRRVRAFALGLCILAGAGIAGSAVRVLGDPASALAEEARLRTGTTDAAQRLGLVDVTGWPWVAVAAGVLIVALGVLGCLTHRAWNTAGRRYERETTAASPGGPVAAAGGTSGTQPDALDTWQALSRGEDPTLAE